ncbi:hypothetical protein [Actinoallomurus acaciae]|uniref:Uncharacterized protein n=1 Tax=Actinoallomurus acaciae TaxID=502577 RepID=A0ABV5YI94_9ACTN
MSEMTIVKITRRSRRRYDQGLTNARAEASLTQISTYVRVLLTCQTQVANVLIEMRDQLVEQVGK